MHDRISDETWKNHCDTLRAEVSSQPKASTWCDDVFDVRCFLVTSVDLGGLAAWMAETFGPDFAERSSDAPLARTLFVQHPTGNALVFWFRDTFSPTDVHWLSVLAHETQHGAHMVLGQRGVKCGDGSEEAFCYYAAYLFREAYGRLVAPPVSATAADAIQ